MGRTRAKTRRENNDYVRYAVVNYVVFLELRKPENAGEFESIVCKLNIAEDNFI